MNNPIDSKRAGLRNERLILSLLRKHGELSQARLCKLTGLGSSTTSYIFARLREKNLITEKPGESSKPGAKPKIVSINPSGLFIVSIEIAPANITAALFDFNCDMVEHFRIPLGSDHSVDNVIRLIEINIKGILSKHEITQDKILGIGVTLSGSITPAGDVELSSPMGWKNVPLGNQLSKYFDCPVKIYTTKVRLLAEIGEEPELQNKNLMYLNVADGVGSTLWIEGNLLHGATNKFGEIGHIIIDPDGPRCGCGHKGCLEALISGPSLAERIKAELKNYPNSQLHSMKEDMLPETIIERWGNALAKNDELAVRIRNFFGETLAKAASIAINCFDPEVILLAGYVCRQCTDYLAETIHSKVQTDVYDNDRRKIMITPAKAGDLALIKGLSIAVLRDSLRIQ